LSNFQFAHVLDKERQWISVQGIRIGLPAAFGVGRLVQSLLFGVKANDPLVFALTVILLVAVSLLASGLPARKAARVDPMVALRYE
jgi:putative ABC transport system permease protein